MFEFVQRFFGKPASSTTAKERLRLVLLSDHLSLAPDVVEALKRDLVEVISRYVEVDSSNCDVTFEQQDKQVAMLANIPILAMRENRPRATGSPQPPAAPPPPPARAPESSPAPEPPSFGTAGASAAVAHEPESEHQTELVLESQAARSDDSAGDGAASGNSRAQRRRRRKRAAAAGSASPQPT